MRDALRPLLMSALLAALPELAMAAKPVPVVLMCLRTSQVTKDLADAVAMAGFSTPDKLSAANAERIGLMVAACEPDSARSGDYARYLRAHLTSLVQSFAIEAEGISPALVEDVIEARAADLRAGADLSEVLIDAVSDALTRSGVKVDTISDEGWYQLGGYIASQSMLTAIEAKLRR